MRILINSNVLDKYAFYYDFYEELKKQVEVITFGSNPNSDICVPFGTLLKDVLSKLTKSIDLIVIASPEQNFFPSDIYCSPVPTVALVVDWEWFYNGIISIVEGFDIILGDRVLIDILRKLNYSNVYFWVPVYMPNYVYKTEIPKVYDITFIGSINIGNNTKRDQFIE